MKKNKLKKILVAASIGIVFTISGLSAAKASAAPSDNSSPDVSSANVLSQDDSFLAQPAIEKPLPTILPTPGIQPLDDFPGKKKLG